MRLPLFLTTLRVGKPGTSGFVPRSQSITISHVFQLPKAKLLSYVLTYVKVAASQPI
jgi:hypothetical protein